MKTIAYHRLCLRWLDAINLNFSFVYILGSGMTCKLKSKIEIESNCGLACKKVLRGACFRIISYYSQLISDLSIRNDRINWIG